MCCGLCKALEWNLHQKYPHEEAAEETEADEEGFQAEGRRSSSVLSLNCLISWQYSEAYCCINLLQVAARLVVSAIGYYNVATMHSYLN